MKKKRQKAGQLQRWSEVTLELRESILKQYEFDSLGEAILANLLDAHARMLQAAAILAREGTIVRDRFQQVRSHPAFEQESVSRASMLKHANALGLDMTELSGREERR